MIRKSSLYHTHRLLHLSSVPSAEYALVQMLLTVRTEYNPI